MTYGELKRLLKKNNCAFYREGANHEIWINRANGETFPISRHNSQEVPIGTLKSIKKDARLK